jgi:hypothetical protein
MNIDILRPLRGSVRRKRPEIWRTNSWFLLHDNAPAHGSILGKDFSAKNNMETLEYFPSFPDLPSAHFYLSPRLNSSLKGRHFSDATNIKNATEELKSLS